MSYLNYKSFFFHVRLPSSLFALLYYSLCLTWRRKNILTVLYSLGRMSWEKAMGIKKHTIKTCIKTMRNRLFCIVILVYIVIKGFDSYSVWNCFSCHIPLGLQVRMTKSVLKMELWESGGGMPLAVDFARSYFVLSPFSEQLSLGLSCRMSSMYTDHPIMSMFTVIRYKEHWKCPLTPNPDTIL